MEQKGQKLRKFPSEFRLRILIWIRYWYTFQKILNIYWDRIVLNLNSDFRNNGIGPGCGSVRKLGSGGASEVRCARAGVGSGRHQAIERIVCGKLFSELWNILTKWLNGILEIFFLTFWVDKMQRYVPPTKFVPLWVSDFSSLSLDYMHAVRKNVMQKK